MSAQTAARPHIPVWINGELKEVPPEQSVAELLAWLGIAADRVAVELNQTIVRRRDWRQALVPGGSHVEIVEFVGGG
ncbi:MAG TPA: sulfur carrier protein ThiS [Bryobacteraceae bacterium]|nr:sulfur carrier protein ThiS [Bryobacteraceae bacterium]